MEIEGLELLTAEELEACWKIAREKATGYRLLPKDDNTPLYEDLINAFLENEVRKVVIDKLKAKL